jgi:hypothetical protein
VSDHDEFHRAGLSLPRRPVPFTDQLRLAVAAYLARFKGSSWQLRGAAEPKLVGGDQGCAHWIMDCVVGAFASRLAGLVAGFGLRWLA